ncbi:MAG: DUF2911 domain-containing protein [Chitinophagaceae bacterium]|jgi:hypothetical protein|nr:DUF2911 domain-containing protein [Chitinophagaceae bacterium]OQY91925.1 MAG: hypothetical protein B6D37_15735 [Sphingobacteriales bacterium UTBCD1]
MKKSFVFILALLIAGSTAFAQQGQSFPPLDKSPMDMSYFPNNYPLLKIQGKASEPLVARVIYSRPQKSGRVIFGELVEYGKVWRLGANEATELELFRNVRIGEKKIPKGRYTLYAIPYENKWTIIVNKEKDTWGAFKYDPKKDMVRVDVPVEKNTEMTEAFSMVFEKRTDGVNLVIAWDNIKVSLPIIF